MTSFFSAGNPLSIFIAISAFLGTLGALVSVHEAAHAWVANRLGDPTAKHQGRVSLNPLVHIDPLGTVVLPLVLIVFSVLSGGGLFLFGWAKPTPFNPGNLQNPQRDAALISFAGPISNFLIAILIAVIYRIIAPFAQDLVLIYLQFLLTLTLILGIFNLIPIAPLDGFKVVAGLLPKDLALSWGRLERIGPLILIALIIFGGPIFQAIVGGTMSYLLSFLIG